MKRKPSPFLFVVILVAVILYGYACAGPAIDHMLDPCRTADQRAMTPACK